MPHPPARPAAAPARGPHLAAERMLDVLTGPQDRAARLTHVERIPERAERAGSWPAWTHPELRAAWERRGITAPWSHQVEVARLAREGTSVIVATGTASGKSLAFLLPSLTAVLEGAEARGGREATALYLSPTKALASDQLRGLTELGLPRLRAATYDGDTSPDQRVWARQHAGYLLTNPDMLHHGLLPGHARWASFLRALRFVIVDEAHLYRGVFGSHVAAVLRRLRRVSAHYGSRPVFLLASATVADPGLSAERLAGVPVTSVVEDGSPRAAGVFGLWEPPLTPVTGEQGAPVRRTAIAETSDLLADLVSAGVRTLAFVRSRRGAEAVAMTARRLLAEVDAGLAAKVASYRGGYLPEERRALERDLHDGRITGLATTNALELGVDVAGLDAVLLAGYPGTRASLWQQAGRAGRRGQGALAVLVARDDPLDTYLVHHPAALFEHPVEASVLDPDNPYVLAPHLCAAAAELPLTGDDEALFGATTPALLDDLTRRGLLRRRPAGWFWTRRERATELADLRGIGGSPVRVVEEGTGRVLGTVDAAAAHTAVHAGAVYLHQGESYVVSRLDLADDVALVRAETVDYSTTARETTEIRVLGEQRSRDWGRARLSFGTVEVTSTVVGFLRRRLGTGEVLSIEPLDLPARRLVTRAVWWTIPADQLERAGVAAADTPGALHAAEHAAIGLLPLVATCDRWDIGGVSTPVHPDTGLPTVFVYDGQAGGAGFAERGYLRAREWLVATRDAVGACGCEAGCPSCVQSPKCGNGNHPLDKPGALRLLGSLLAGAGHA